jgi:hypothetical protein
MKSGIGNLLVATLCATAIAHPVTLKADPRKQSTGEVGMEHVGRTFLFDYGELVVKVRYLSDHRLAWQQIKGPEVGQQAEEEYRFATIRPGVYFVWWQEKDTSVVTQVVDFEKRVVHTTWISPEKKVASFKGGITRRMRRAFRGNVGSQVTDARDSARSAQLIEAKVMESLGGAA